MKTTVLLVDDDAAVRDLVKPALERAGHRVLSAGGADEAASLLREEKVDLLLLDVQLPGLSGFDLLDVLKKDPATAGLPVIMITSRSEERSRVRGLKAGADDYVVKPFSVAELAARVEALLRRARSGGDPSGALTAGPFRLEEASREAFVDGRPVALTGTEFKLLWLLARRPGRVVPRGSLSRELSADGRETSADTLYAHVRNLREKLGKAGGRVLSIHGTGYKLEV